MAALSMLSLLANQADSIQLRSETALRKQLRKFRNKTNGSLDTNRIPDGEVKWALRTKIQHGAETFNDLLRNAPNSFTGILDTGASWNAINDPNLCDPKSIKLLETPIILDGIAGGLKIEKTGEMNIDVVTQSGEIKTIRASAMIHESLPGILLCPQALLKDSSTNTSDHFRVYHDRMEWYEQGQQLLTVPYDTSFLPRMTFFRKGCADASLKGLFGSVHDTNKNLSPLKKLWLKWHIKLGHLSFSHTQKLAIGGFLDKSGLGLSGVPTGEQPQCEACRYGKQQRIPDKTNTH
ncbi:MAG: GAG-pre-integrase domain-containing protein, partial [Plesiomonas shigelloides]